MNDPRFFTFVTVFCVVFLSFTVSPGYQNSIGDQGGYYLPQLMYTLFPERYGDDLLYHVRQTDLSLYNTVVLALASLVADDIYLALFFLAVLFRIVFAYAVYALARHMTRSRTGGLVAMGAIMLVPTYLYGNGLRMLDPETEVRLLAYALGFAGIACYFYCYRIRAFLLVTGALLLHPISAVVFVAYVSCAHVYEVWRERAWATYMPWFLGIPLCGLVFMVAVMGGDTSIPLFGIVDPAWRGIMQDALPSILLSSWGVASFLTLGVSTIGVAVLYMRYTPHAHHREKVLVAMMGVIPLVLLALMYLLADVLSLHIVIALQFARGLIVLKMLLIILAVWWMLDTVRSKRASFRMVFLSTFFFFIVLVDDRWLVAVLPIYLTVWLTTPEMQKGAGYHRVVRRVARFVNRFAIPLYVSTWGFVTGGALLVYMMPAHTSHVLRIPIERAEQFALAFFISILLAGIVASVVVFMGTEVLRRNRVGVVLLCGVLISSVWSNERISLYPVLERNSDASALCEWVREHATRDTLFLIAQGKDADGYSSYVRVSCGATLYAAGEGGQSVFDRAYAFEFVRREGLVQMLKDRHPGVITHAREAGVSYVVAVEEEPSATFEGEVVVFESGNVRVYAL